MFSFQPCVRSEPANRRITYTLGGDTKFFKGDFGDGGKISFTTASTDAECGVYLELHEEYVMSLSGRNGEPLYTASLCGLDENWSNVSDEDKAALEAGCPDGLCEPVCGEFQVRQLITRSNKHIARKNMKTVGLYYTGRLERIKAYSGTSEFGVRGSPVNDVYRGVLLP